MTELELVPLFSWVAGPGLGDAASPEAFLLCALRSPPSRSSMLPPPTHHHQLLVRRPSAPDASPAAPQPPRVALVVVTRRSDPPPPPTPPSEPPSRRQEGVVLAVLAARKAHARSLAASPPMMKRRMGERHNRGKFTFEILKNEKVNSKAGRDACVAPRPRGLTMCDEVRSREPRRAPSSLTDTLASSSLSLSLFSVRGLPTPSLPYCGTTLGDSSSFSRGPCHHKAFTFFAKTRTCCPLDGGRVTGLGGT